jgi:hypothetical protein
MGILFGWKTFTVIIMVGLAARVGAVLAGRRPVKEREKTRGDIARK